MNYVYTYYNNHTLTVRVKTDNEILRTERCTCSGNAECRFCLALIKFTIGKLFPTDNG